MDATTKASQAFDLLEHTSRLMWQIREQSEFDEISRRVSALQAQVAVHGALEPTITNLRSPATIPTAQARLSKFIEMIYGVAEGKSDIRTETLRQLDQDVFIFIGISYAPSEIPKMGRPEFQYLIDTTAKLMRVRNLPSRWMFRNEIQMAIASKADLKTTAALRKSYYTLEFQEELSAEQLAKRRRLDATENEASNMNYDAPNYGPQKTVIQCLGARVDQLEAVLGAKLVHVIQSSRQWKLERERDIASSTVRTDSVMVMFSNSEQDVSIMIRAGYFEGQAVVHQLGCKRSDVLM
ncbi:hypothetical protein JX266_013610 [Neoarthrinium moseri]|nr:hypothetical protein JX266_013610 [Neoarthrinium moseri]